VISVTQDGSEPKVIATGKVGWLVSWSPDGTKIAYDDYSEETKTRQIFIKDPSSSAVAYRLPGQETDHDNSGAVWSPDGKQLVFTRVERTDLKKEKK
jgi:Tol biopolymer transport system component